MKPEEKMIAALKGKGVECEADEYGMSITIDGEVFSINAEECSSLGPGAILEFIRYVKC